MYYDFMVVMVIVVPYLTNVFIESEAITHLSIGYTVAGFFSKLSGFG